MKKYTAIYLKHFGYTTADFVPCEVCGQRAVDIHHVETRGRRKELEYDIDNLVALCRPCHQEKGDKKQYMDMFRDIISRRKK
jgi:5-methylcytosine-specific restriction endonuclease McrA